MVFVAGESSRSQLYIRSLDSLEVQPVAGTEGARNPFFSPNGDWVGFFAAGKLKKVAVGGGAPISICDAANFVGGASWGLDDMIIFAPISTVGLFRVPAAGGEPEVLTTLDRQSGEISHRWPHILPGGKAVLFNVSGGPNWDQWPIVMQSLETGERKVIVDAGSHARYVPTGHIIYGRSGTLLAVPFDLEKLEVTGPPVPILEGVLTAIEGTVDFSVSRTGSLVYLTGDVGEAQHRLVWVDRNGAEQPIAAPPRNYDNPRLSPDGRRIATFLRGETVDVWIYDISGQTLSRMTNEGSNQYPIWTPDGKRITFRATRQGLRNIWWKSADGSGPEERLTTGENNQSPRDWSPDGNVLVYNDGDPNTRADVWMLSMDGERKAIPLIQTPFRDDRPTFSPDGRWLAYMSDESGRSEVYVQPFPGPAGKRQVSTDGGTNVRWARSGRELFYRSGNKVMAISVQTQPAFVSERPRLLFETSPAILPAFDVAPDDQRFLMVKVSEKELPAAQINVVLNWFEELKQKVPTGN